jgi:hypothetical protein
MVKSPLLMVYLSKSSRGLRMGLMELMSKMNF